MIYLLKAREKEVYYKNLKVAEHNYRLAIARAWPGDSITLYSIKDGNWNAPRNLLRNHQTSHDSNPQQNPLHTASKSLGTLTNPGGP